MSRQTVVETPSYITLAGKLFSESEREDIVAMVAKDPQCGDVMAGTGGFGRFACRAKVSAKAAGRELYISGARTDFRSS
ncbi:MAG: hypothetical protein ABSA80_03325 [Terriglobales bacterium]|jgi:hypothetical protein